VPGQLVQQGCLALSWHCVHRMLLHDVLRGTVMLLHDVLRGTVMVHCSYWFMYVCRLSVPLAFAGLYGNGQWAMQISL
jgi:ADP-dependent phosphofructokinase/glucokinase